MSLFGKIVKTTVNVALLPVALVQDFATLGKCANPGEDCYTKEALDRIKREADE